MKAGITDVKQLVFADPTAATTYNNWMDCYSKVLKPKNDEMSGDENDYAK